MFRRSVFPLLAAATLMTTTPNARAEGEYRHFVVLKFKDDATAEQITEVQKAFVALQEKIDTIKDLEWGTDVSPEGLAKGFTHAFLVTFDNKAGLEAYLPHEDHKAFGAKLHPVLEDVFVIDYVAQ